MWWWKFYFKILLWFIKKPWCTCTFLNHFREASEQLLCTLFQWILPYCYFSLYRTFLGILSVLQNFRKRMHKKEIIFLAKSSHFDFKIKVCNLHNVEIFNWNSAKFFHEFNIPENNLKIFIFTNCFWKKHFVGKFIENWISVKTFHYHLRMVILYPPSPDVC